jgi:hypothetical protein
MGAPSGLLRADMSAKPAYKRLMQLIKGEWWTDVTTLTDADGQARLRTFWGSYRIEVRLDDKILSGTFDLSRDTEIPITVQLVAE